ncbi:MAG: hypothetical protein AABZ55_15550, partial [Bdellovibrionota bacterium]
AAGLDMDSDIEEKKVSRFEGDIDLQGVDEADLEAQEESTEEGATEAAPAVETPKAAPATEKAKAPKKAKK